MKSQNPNQFGTLRTTIVILLALSALFGLYLDFAYTEPQWIIADDPIGRFLAFLVINLGPEIAIVGSGLILLEFFLSQKNKTLNN